MIMHNFPHFAVGVVGATGYPGLEVLRVLRHHGGGEVRFATAEGSAGEPSGFPGRELVAGEAASLDGVELVFLCLPHGKAVEWAERAGAAGVRVVDLTADHRPGSGREEGWVYGLADLAAARIAGARRVANPGCYPTGPILALAPRYKLGALADERVIIDAASGVSGAGAKPSPTTQFCNVADNYSAYNIGHVHRHTPEIEQELTAAAGRA
ncbi:MAG: N-acetyl-gamma-glutamyl-phosphate reductase, partial [Gemmatimonadetes bacterium]|nr:N-acetyl-gamma-glutamyl-phosphate reductase [Gemmatimonadota bacterium]